MQLTLARKSELRNWQAVQSPVLRRSFRFFPAVAKKIASSIFTRREGQAE